MSEKPNTSSQKARDEALRALVTQGGLTLEQVSELKLDQVHLAIGALIIEPDEFDPATVATERPIRLKLDDTMQRALISWLVVRPDGPNHHLFPGVGTSGLDAESISQVLAAEKPEPAKPPHPSDETAVPAGAEREEPEKSSEFVPPRPPTVDKREKPTPPPPSVTTRREEPGAVPLDEIESLRKRLAETYDAWAPAVPAAPLKPTVGPAPGRDATSVPSVGAESPAELTDTEASPEPAIMPSPREKAMPTRVPVPEPGRPAPAPQPISVGLPPSVPQKTGVSEPPPESPEKPGVAVSAPPPSAALDDRLKGVWKSSEGKVTFNLTYRSAALAGVALVLVVCCLGLVIASGTMFGSGTMTGFLPGVTSTETQTPTAGVPSATPTLSPPPTATATSTATVAPSATFTPLLAPTSTPATTSTPVVIVVTATPTPEPSLTATSIPTNTPESAVSPEPTPTETPGFKYAAPELVWPEDGSTVPGAINVLQWEPVADPLADDEWYAVRLIYREQGQPVYAGDRVRVPEWRVPDRLYYRADGPDLEYSWYVFVERENPDGSTTSLSPDSETFIFRWE